MFKDRKEAGKRLAGALKKYNNEYNNDYPDLI